MTKNKVLYLATLFIAITFSANSQIKSPWIWTHLSSEYGDVDVPCEGSIQTGSLIGDFNKDGVSDFVITEKTEASPIALFIFESPKKWKKYTVEKRKVDIGECVTAFDVDNDGDLDIVAASESTNQIWWWENPSPKLDARRPWKRYTIRDSGEPYCQDMVFGDFNGDKKAELAFWNQGANQLCVAQMPDDVTKAKSWTITPIYQYSTECETMQRSYNTKIKSKQGINFHEGICAADINNDGVVNIVGGGMYFIYKDGKYIEQDVDLSYVSSRVDVGQIVEGGRPEIVMVSGDGFGPVVLYQFVEGTWVAKIIDKSTRKTHTLKIIDFNNDGMLDIVGMEMQDKDIPDPKAFVLINKGNDVFARFDIAGGGGHNSVIGDLDGDGDIDIVSKPYNAGKSRIDIWVNEGEKK